MKTHAHAAALEALQLLRKRDAQNAENSYTRAAELTAQADQAREDAEAYTARRREVETSIRALGGVVE